MKVPQQIPVSEVCEIVRYCLANEDLGAMSGDFELTCAVVEYFVSKDKPARAPRPRRSRAKSEETPTADAPAKETETTEEAEVVGEPATEEPTRRRGWPKGKPRGPKKTHVEATTLSGAPLPQGGGDGTATQAEF
jgi:hypothetical protein